MILVDELCPCKNSFHWPYNKSCHLSTFPPTSDNIEALHNFAEKIGLKRAYFQQNSWPHYDLTSKKRIQAIENGAIEITNEAFARMRIEAASKEGKA